MLASRRFRDELIRQIDEFKELSGLSDSTISRRVFPGDSGFARKVRSGASFTMDKAERMEIFLYKAIRAEKQSKRAFAKAEAELQANSLA